jgi:hypothetical protein
MTTNGMKCLVVDRDLVAFVNGGWVPILNDSIRDLVTSSCPVGLCGMITLNDLREEEVVEQLMDTMHSWWPTFYVFDLVQSPEQQAWSFSRRYQNLAEWVDTGMTPPFIKLMPYNQASQLAAGELT